MTDILILAAALCAYPVMVLLVAITGPHSETEKAELLAYRAEKRRAHILERNPK